MRALVSGNAIGRFRLGVLDRDLHVIESGHPELPHALRRDPDPGGDEVGVKPRIVRRSSDRDDIAPGARLAA